MNILNPFWRKNLLILALIIFGYSAIIFFVIIPSVNQTTESKKAITDKQQELDLLDFQLQTLQKRTHFSEAFDVIKSGTSSLLPNNTETSTFIVQLENLANENRAIISNLSITEPKLTTKGSDKTQVQAITFSFNVDSSYDTITSIMKGLETLPRFNSVSSINMIARDDGTISTLIKGTIYYGKQ